MKDFLTKTANALLSALFPDGITCELCGKDVFNGELVCKECEKRLNFSDDAVCDRCGRTDPSRPSACPSCENMLGIDKARSVFNYVDGGERLVKSFKYSSAKYLSKPLAAFMKNVYYKNYFSPDVICYVPMTVKKQYARGYNQAELIARELSSLVSVPCEDLLEKIKDTPHQAGLGFEERQKNLRGAYALKSGASVKGKKILLVDDVLTTGATAGEIAGILKRRGAKSVYLLTLASVQHNYQAHSDDKDNHPEELWDL